MAMDSSNKERSIDFLHKVDPIDSFWNWKQHQPNNNNNNKNKNKNLKRWNLDEKRFAAPELFGTIRRKNAATDTYVLGPGAGAGVGCGVGLGLGLVGGAGFNGGLWNHLRLAIGFGFGCGVGVGFGYAQGFGYGSSWKSIKSDVLGFDD